MEKVLNFKTKKTIEDLRKYEGPTYTIGELLQKIGECDSLWASYETEPAKDLFVEKCKFLRKWVPELNMRAPFLDKPRTPGPLRIGIISINLTKLSSVAFTSGTMLQFMDNVKVITCSNEMFNYKNFMKLKFNLHDDIKAIIEQEFDVLLYADIHLHKYTDMLAMMRLARVQATTWGHSDTSGMDSIDHYITSNLFEVADHQKYYSENVIAGNSLTVFYPNMKPDMSVREPHGFEKYAVLACSPYKVNRKNLEMILEIQKRTDIDILVIDYKLPNDDTQDILNDVGIRYKTTERVSVKDFMGILSKSVVVFDTHPFGNCNIAFQSFMGGACMVTYPSDRLYGRFVAGLYNRMGDDKLRSLIVRSWDAYVEKNVEVINDNSEYKQKITENVHKITQESESITEMDGILTSITSLPQILHFVYGLKCVEEMSFVHFMAIWSAMYHNKIEKVMFWYHYEPTGMWWERIKPYLTLRQVELDDRFDHYAHHADYIRLCALYDHGGIYLDMDTVSVRALDVVPGGVTIGSQNRPNGLCNAIIASVPRAQFIRDWLDNWDFEKVGPVGSQYWDYPSVKLPMMLYKQNHVNVTVRINWHTVHWSDAERIFLDDESVVPTAPVYHLCESMYYNRLNSVTPDTLSGMYKRMVWQFCTVPPLKFSFGKDVNVKGVKSFSDEELRKYVNAKYPQFAKVDDRTAIEIAKHVMVYTIGGSEYGSEHSTPFVVDTCPLASSKGNPAVLKLMKQKLEHYVTEDYQYIDTFKLVWHGNGSFLGYLSGDTIYNSDGTTMSISRVTSQVYKYIPKKYPCDEKPLTPCDTITPTGKETLTWIVAVHNRADLVKDTIRSIMDQTVDCKCIICDDGSTDTSFEVVKELIKDHGGKFTLIKNETNLGYPKTCRKMNDMVTTDVVAIVDSDDVLCTNATERILQEFRTRSCVMAVTRRYNWSGPNGMKRESRSFVAGSELINDQYEHIRSWRKECLPESAFSTDIQYAEDRDLFYRMEEVGPISKIDEPLMYFRHHGNSIMSDKLPLARRDHAKAKLYALTRRGIL